MTHENGHADRSAFLKPAARRYTDYSVPGFGTVRIQSITERERHQFEASLLDEHGSFDKGRAALGRVKFISLCIVDSDGLRILADSDLQQIYQNMDAAVVAAIYDRCKTHCNLDENPEKNLSDLPETAAADSPSS